MKQVEGADHAVKFWLGVVDTYTTENNIKQGYQDDILDDSQWSMVIRQRFSHE
ncbi:hypothetical protein [Aliivibrio finisterrensis]|uniref:hypothetical protein n=1 Tax=Aliivibrio finisterrensis TaxID=511998 RepID=UPI00142EEB84|nr:hypothetical protein [Aliivibrio finisterrensis]